MALRAVVAICLDARQEVEATNVDCFGDESVLRHLPSVAIDKLLVDLSRDGAGRAKLYSVFESKVGCAVSEFPMRPSFGRRSSIRLRARQT